MDTKRLFTNVSIVVLVIVGWQLSLSALHRLYPEWWAAAPAATATATTATATTAPAVAVAPPTTGPTTSQATAPVVAAATPPAPAGTAAAGSDVPTKTVVGSLAVKDPVYAMALTIDPRGAGLSSVTLNDYFESADQKDSYKYQVPISGDEDITRPLATRSIKINGQQVVELGALYWTRTASTADSVTYSVTINDNGSPLLVIDKTYTVPPRKSPSDGFDVAVTQKFTNKSAKLLTVSTEFNGPTPPKKENDRSEDRRYVTGYDADDKYKSIDIVHTFVGDLAKDKPAKELVTNSDGRPAMWVGVCNSYFDAIYKPDYTGTNEPAPVKIVSMSAVGLDPGASKLDLPTALKITTGDFTIAPGASIPLNAHAFFGPKQRQLLKDTPYYADFPRSYDTTLIYVSRFCAFITFGWLINGLYGILWFFDKIFRDWGLSIIGLVCLVRLLLHPITKRAQINMVRMSKMGPEIERLKKKYGDDKVELNKAMMSVYREQGVGGALGCLPMFLQTPIWIALWNALQSTFELRQAPFLRFGHVHLTWIADLSRPDAMIPFHTPITIPLVNFTITSLNLLPLLMAVVTYLQQSLTPAPPNMTPEQQQQRNMMKWMSLIVPVFLYNGPSGLNLYILTSSTLGIIEQKIVRDHIKARDEAEKAGLVLIDHQPYRGKPKKEGWFARKFAGLSKKIAEAMAKAEEIRREGERRGKKKA
jgi:YidC/Oxa1 family membrane protein insertase